MSAEGLDQLKFDLESLYKEESYTDLKVGQFRKLIPIKPDGSVDDKRDTIITASTHVMSPGGPLPINCELEAKTLEDAAKEFPGAVEKAIAQMIDEAKQYRQEQQSRIVVPDAGANLGGNIQMP